MKIDKTIICQKIINSAGVVSNARVDAENLGDELRKKAQKKDGVGNGQTPILLAAKHGITEIVKKILEMNLIAIHDVDMDKNTKKNSWKFFKDVNFFCSLIIVDCIPHPPS